MLMLLGSRRRLVQYSWPLETPSEGNLQRPRLDPAAVESFTVVFAAARRLGLDSVLRS